MAQKQPNPWPPVGGAPARLTSTIQIGDEVRDRISGFRGIVIARTEWFNGCMRLTVQTKKLGADGKPVDVTLDEPQLELVKAKALPRPPLAVMDRSKGGPIPEPARQRVITVR